MVFLLQVVLFYGRFVFMDSLLVDEFEFLRRQRLINALEWVFVSLRDNVVPGKSVIAVETVESVVRNIVVSLRANRNKFVPGSEEAVTNFFETQAVVDVVRGVAVSVRDIADGEPFIEFVKVERTIFNVVYSIQVGGVLSVDV